MNVVSVLIVDDHYLVIEGVRSLLQDEKRIEWLDMLLLLNLAWPF